VANGKQFRYPEMHALYENFSLLLSTRLCFQTEAGEFGVVENGGLYNRWKPCEASSSKFEVWHDFLLESPPGRHRK
jgi:hypothetical protein